MRALAKIRVASFCLALVVLILWSPHTVFAQTLYGYENVYATAVPNIAPPIVPTAVVPTPNTPTPVVPSPNLVPTNAPPSLVYVYPYPYGINNVQVLVVTPAGLVIP